MAESSLPRDRNDNMSESHTASVSTFGDLSPIRNTDANDVSMIDFEAEYALMTTKPPFDPNEDQMDVMDMSSNEDSITLRGDTNADTYVLFMTTIIVWNLNHCNMIA